jgi:hypothetical protein
MKASQMLRRQFLKIGGAILATIPSCLFLAGPMLRPTMLADSISWWRAA